MVFRSQANRVQLRDFLNNLESLAGPVYGGRMSDSSYASRCLNPRDEGLKHSASSASCQAPRLVARNVEVERLVEQISGLFMDAECSDVTLVVEGTRFPAHKVILAARSTYFRCLFFNGMRESTDKTVELQETPMHAFRMLLKYIYTGTLHLDCVKIDMVFDMLGLVHKYGFIELEKTISEHLKAICTTENVCAIQSVSQLYSMKSLAQFCLDFIDNYADQVIKQSNFRQLSAAALEEIIKRDSFCAPEIEIFNAVTRWMEANPEEAPCFPELMSHIRLSLIKLDDLLNIIRPSGMIPADVLLDAINDQTKKKTCDFVYRGYLIHNTNVAAKNKGLKVLHGENKCNFYNADGIRFDADRDVLKHQINEKDTGIILELSHPYIINHIRFQLADRDNKSALSYYVEVSMDSRDWIRVIDHTKYLCRHKQFLYFSKRVVKYVRICGTGPTVNSTFQITGLEAMYTTEDFQFDPKTTVYIPTENVATIPKNASVIEGVSRSRNNLINGDFSSYDWDNGYTCHQLGSGSIIVQLPQPYMIGSFCLLLWDCDDRKYSYYIEVSYDQTNWTRVVEENEVSSWRVVKFEMQPVVFIKIVGTYNSANDIFHCVHFACPVGELEAAPTKSDSPNVHTEESADDRPATSSND